MKNNKIFVYNLIHFFEINKLPVYGAFMEGKELKKASLITPSILVIGNEGKGINQHLFPYITQKISIKRFGEAESLNAAIATAIICDHFLNV